MSDGAFVELGSLYRAMGSHLVGLLRHFKWKLDEGGTQARVVKLREPLTIATCKPSSRIGDRLPKAAQ